MRQETPAYRAAAKLLSEGKTVEGFDALDGLGWVKELGDDERYAAIAADYLQALNEKKSVLVVSPTHEEAAIITDAIRSTLREAGKLGTEEREFTRLVQVNASEAGAGPGGNLPAGRRAPVPPERQGRHHQGRAVHRHRSGQGAARRGGEILTLPAGDRFRSRPATSSASPAR